LEHMELASFTVSGSYKETKTPLSLSTQIDGKLQTIQSPLY